MREKIDVIYKLRVTKSESEVLEKRFEKSHLKSMSSFLRQQVVQGIYLEYDKKEIQNIRRAIVSCANNINQIACRVNSTNRIYSDDINELKKEIDKVWQQLRSIQSTLQKLNPSST